MRGRLIVAVLFTLALSASNAASGAGAPLYPDLRTLPPSDLMFDKVVLSDGAQHHVVRFANTVWNAGPGRFEAEGKKRSKIYQNVYDAASGGALAERLYLGNDSVFHQGHNHYHLENFASYELLAKDSAGSYQPSGRKGTKTSFCVIDTHQVASTAAARQYWQCGRTLQGLSVGWGDEYGAMLADQWIDLGLASASGTPLPDGEYAVRSTANPPTGNAAPRLRETDSTNNTAVTYFTVIGGVLSNVRTAP